MNKKKLSKGKDYKAEKEMATEKGLKGAQNILNALWGNPTKYETSDANLYTENLETKDMYDLMQECSRVGIKATQAHSRDRIIGNLVKKFQEYQAVENRGTGPEPILNNKKSERAESQLKRLFR